MGTVVCLHASICYPLFSSVVLLLESEFSELPFRLAMVRGTVEWARFNALRAFVKGVLAVPHGYGKHMEFLVRQVAGSLLKRCSLAEKAGLDVGELPLWMTPDTVDKKIIANMFKTFVAQFEKHDSKFFESWNEILLAQPHWLEPTFQFECSVCSWDAFWEWLHEKISVIPLALAKAILPLSEDFEKAFSKKDGPGETLRSFQWHLQIYANQNEQLTRHWLEPEEGVLYSVADFADLNVFY